MERLLDRALSRAEAVMAAEGEGATAGAAGAKAVADTVALIARTIEKIEDLKRSAAREALAAGLAGPSSIERDDLRRQVGEWIEARAGERAEELLRARAAEREDRPLPLPASGDPRAGAG